MNIIDAIVGGLTASVSSLAKIALIVFPLMLIIEVAKDTGVMAKISHRVEPLARPFDLSGHAVFPLLIGLVFGLSYGSGVLINATKQGDLTRHDRYSIAIFLSLCHALIEDTVLLTAVGANVGWLLSSRILLPLLITPVIMRVFFHSNEAVDYPSHSQKISPHLK